MNDNKTIQLSVLIFILVVTGLYNSLIFIKAEEYIFGRFDQTTNILLSISFINAIHFLFRPFGGIIWAWLQHKSKNLLLPYLILFYSVYNLSAVVFNGYLKIELIVVSAITNFILIGILLGGIYPQVILCLMKKATSPLSKVVYGNLYFILIFLGMIFGKLTLIKQSESWAQSLITIMPVIFIIISVVIFRNKAIWQSFSIENMPLCDMLSVLSCIKLNYWIIIRFTCFLTFVTSLNAFFSTIMPFYLVRYLGYSELLIFKLQVIIFICAIAGLIIGSIFHMRLGRKQHILLGLVIKIILYFLFKAYITNNLSAIIIYESICMFFVGLMLSKILAILVSIFPVKARLNSISVIYNLAFGLFSGIAVFLSTFLINQFGSLYMPSLIIISFSYLSLISLWFTQNKDFFCYN